MSREQLFLGQRFILGFDQWKFFEKSEKYLKNSNLKNKNFLKFLPKTLANYTYFANLIKS
jgi:hypothetical protein